MKQIIFFLVAIWPTALQCQVHGGVGAGFGYNKMSGDGTGISQDDGWQAGVWVEPMATERFGVYGSLAYTQRGGKISPDVELTAEYVTAMIMPRFRIPAKDRAVAFVAGGGGYLGWLTEKADDQTDYGLCGQAGLEWKRVSAVLYFQQGLKDVVAVIAGGQRWISAGLVVNVRVF